MFLKEVYYAHQGKAAFNWSKIYCEIYKFK